MGKFKRLLNNSTHSPGMKLYKVNAESLKGSKEIASHPMLAGRMD